MHDILTDEFCSFLERAEEWGTLKVVKSEKVCQGLWWDEGVTKARAL